MKSRKKLVVIGGIVLAVALAAYLIFIKESPNQPDSPPEQSVKERLNVDEIGEIKSNLGDDQDIFNTMITTGSVLAGSGDPEGAEEYYVAALEHAKSTQDQGMIDGGYRVLLSYYREFGLTDKYDSLAAELGEDGLERIFKLDPRDEAGVQ